jgi:hypothetical protein
MQSPLPPIPAATVLEPVAETNEKPGFVESLAWLGASAVLTCASQTFYRRALRRGMGLAVLAFSLYMLTATLLTVGLVNQSIEQAARSLQVYLAQKQMPTITIRDGIATSDGSQTVVLEDQSPSSIIAIDFTGRYTQNSLNSYQTGFILNRDTLYMKSSQGLRDYPLIDINNSLQTNPILVNATTIQQTIAKYRPLVGTLTGIFVFTWDCIFRLTFILLMALLMWGITSIIRPNAGYMPVLTIGLYAFIPADYANFLLESNQVSFFGMRTLLHLVIWGIALALAFGKGSKQPLRLWRALLGIPMLAVMAYQYVFNDAGTRWFVSIIMAVTVAALMVIGWYTREKEELGALPPTGLSQ